MNILLKWLWKFVDHDGPVSEVHLPGYYSREVRRNFKRLGDLGMLQFIHFIRLETPPDGYSVERLEDTVPQDDKGSERNQHCWEEQLSSIGHTVDRGHVLRIVLPDNNGGDRSQNNIINKMGTIIIISTKVTEAAESASNCYWNVCFSPFPSEWNRVSSGI